MTFSLPINNETSQKHIIVGISCKCMRALLANSSRKISSSSMRHRAVLAVFFLILVVALLLDDVSGGRGSRRGGRSSRGGSSGGRRTSFRSSRRSRSSSRHRSSQYGPDSPSKPRITKFTPIKPSTFRTPVIAKQTKLGSRAKLFTGVVAGYLVTKYLLRNAPVYRGGFPVYGSYGIHSSEPSSEAFFRKSEFAGLQWKPLPGTLFSETDPQRRNRRQHHRSLYSCELHG